MGGWVASSGELGTWLYRQVSVCLFVERCVRTAGEERRHRVASRAAASTVGIAWLVAASWQPLSAILSAAESKAADHAAAAAAAAAASAAAAGRFMSVYR